MLQINRCVVILRPKQPFLDWIHSWDTHRYTLADLREDPTAYLLPEHELFDEQRVLLQVYYSFLFEEELEAWYTDDALWPHEPTLETFYEWFDYEFHSLVFDVIDELPLGHIEYVDDRNNGH